MPTVMTVAFFCYAASALLVLVFGLVYLTRRRFMLYHAVAVGQEWAEVPAGYQALILALQRSVGAGLVATAFFVVALLLGPFRAGEAWALWVTPAGLLILSVGSLFAMFGVKARTAAKPPYQLVLGAGVLTLAGWIVSLAG